MNKSRGKFLQKEDISFPNTLKNRFYSKVLMPQTEDGCMEWIGSKGIDGYGYFNAGKVSPSAHRFSYILHYGKIERDKVICHKCDNPSCVRPDHLFMATQIENIADRDNKKRTSKGITRSNAKLTDSQVLEIRENNELTYSAIGKIYNIAKSTVSFIKKRKIWRHI